MAPATKERGRARRGNSPINPPEPTPVVEAVPVRHTAEFIPASYAASPDSDGEDQLNDPESRFYKTGEDSISLVFNQGLLEFSISALMAICQRAETMDITDLGEVLDLE